jgi:hypothetical protein
MKIKLMLIVGAFAALVLTGAKPAYADLLPPICDDDTSFACKSYLEQSEKCNVIKKFRSDIEPEDIKRQNERDKDPLCQAYASGDDVAVPLVCANLVYACSRMPGIVANPWLYIGISVTIVSEVVAIYVLCRKKLGTVLKKVLITSAPLNVLTNALLSVSLAYISMQTSSMALYITIALLLELVVIATEAFVYMKACGLQRKTAVTISAIANIASIVVGILINILLAI